MHTLSQVSQVRPAFVSDRDIYPTLKSAQIKHILVKTSKTAHAQ